MAEFSIIVPIYNVEKYLRLCIDSILSQTYKNFEVILIDDGSPDRSGDICDKYAEEDIRVRAIHKRNGGLSSARNAGLEVASGCYVIFVDSDDYWDDNKALEHIHKNLTETQADLLIFPAKRFYEEENRYTNILNFKVDRNRIINSNVNDAVRYMLENNIYRAAAWNKVIKKEIIDVHQMRFKEGYLSEDMDWCGDLLLYCKKFDYYGNPFYCYRQQRSGSITSGKTEKLVSDKLYMIEKGMKQALQLSTPQKELLASYYAYEYSVTLGVSGEARDRYILKKMKELRGCLSYDICNKVKKVRKLYGIVGYELTKKALCLFVQIKK